MHTGQTAAALAEDVIGDFGARLRGDLIRPADARYDAARAVWNAMMDCRPAMIAMCVGTADVVQAVSFARAHGLELSIRSGGHHVSGSAIVDGGLVIDLSRMRGIRVDRHARLVRAESGSVWSDLDQETQAFGMATPGAIVSTTGIAGVTLGGGAGWLNGKYGLASDNLISADVVTADGRVVVASDHDHPDLFWALRGGGGNFGVVTSLEFRVHELGATVLAGLLLHPFARADEMLRMFRDVTASAPDELTVYAAVLTLSDGARFAALAVCYAGDLDEGERILTPLRLFGPPLADTIQPMPYRTWQGAFDSFFPTGRRNYWKSGMLRFIDDAAIEVIAAHARSLSSPHSVVLIEHFHGACSNAVAPDTAWPHRHLPYHLLVLSQWIDPAQDQAHIDWTRAFHRQLQPHLDTGVCLNALSADEGDDRIRAAYGASYDRLAAVKRTWDPGNVFHAIPSITPANLEPEAHTGGIPALGA